MKLNITLKLSLITLLTLLTVYPNETNKYPAVPIEIEGKYYLAFTYPSPATNVVQALIDLELYKKYYNISSSLLKDQSKLLKKQKKDLRREKIRRVLTIIGIGLSARDTGFATGYVVHALK